MLLDGQGQHAVAVKNPLDFCENSIAVASVGGYGANKRKYRCKNRQTHMLKSAADHRSYPFRDPSCLQI